MSVATEHNRKKERNCVELEDEHDSKSWNKQRLGFSVHIPV